VIAAVVALLFGMAIGVFAYQREPDPVEKRGSAGQEFTSTETARKPVRRKNPRRPWPTYAYNRARDHVSPFSHRPPVRRIWKIDGHDTLEFPPSIGYGRVYLAQQKGLFLALGVRSGHVRWRKKTGRCAASSPTIGRGLVYQAYMHKVPCPQGQPGADGFLIAWNVLTGRKRWKFKAAPIESSPLLVRRTLYFGSWNRRVYAVNARTGRKRWSYTTDEEVNTSAAYWNGTIYIATDAGTLYALSARTGRLRWKAHPGSGEFFYATPTVAYGRVYIGQTDGTMYSFGARSGRLRWARSLGTYVYAAAAAYKRRIFVGTYDGWMYALDAATGDVRWKRAAPGAVHAAPTIMRGLVYYATCSSCGQDAARAVKKGPDRTVAIKASNGRKVWSFRAGKFANPVVADSKRIYLTSRAHLFALKPAKGRSRGEEKREKRRSARQRSRHR